MDSLEHPRLDGLFFPESLLSPVKCEHMPHIGKKNTKNLCDKSGQADRAQPGEQHGKTESRMLGTLGAGLLSIWSICPRPSGPWICEVLILTTPHPRPRLQASQLSEFPDDHTPALLSLGRRRQLRSVVILFLGDDLSPTP